MKTFHKLLSAGAITALSFSPALVAQERPAQPGQPSPQVQEREQHTPQAGEQSEELERALERAQEQQQDQPQFGARAELHHKASELKGSKLNTQAGESLGEVEDIAIKLENGELAYLLVEAEGGEFKPVPAQAVNIQKRGEEIELTVNIEKQKWEQAETISKEEIAQLSQEQRAREIYQFFGEDYQQHQQQLQFGAPDRPSQQDQEQSSQPHLPEARSSEQSQGSQSQEFGQQQQPRPGERTGQQSPRPGERIGQQSPRPGERVGQQQSGIQSRQQQQQSQVSLGSKLMEAKIQNEQQEEIGQISDLILNVEESRIEFVLIEPQEQEGTFAVSPQAFQMSGEDQVRLNVSQQDFQQAQELREVEVSQRARQARMSASQSQQDPQIYRYEAEESGSLFGAPERDEKKEKKEEKAKEYKPKKDQL